MSSRPRTMVRSDSSYLTEWRRSLDWSIVAAAFLLIGIGLVLVLAAGSAVAAREDIQNSNYFAQKQFAFAIMGGVILLGASLLDRDWVRRFAALVFIGAFLLMATVLISGYEAKGAQRWIRIAGFSLQPSELIKPALIVMAGWLLAQRTLFPEGPWIPVAFALFVSTLGLLLLQPDIGQSVLISTAFIGTFFVSGLPKRLAAIFAIGGSALGACLYMIIPHVRHRVDSFLFPSAHDTEQIDKAVEAISRGGLFGQGPGEGVVKYQLPDSHADFIFAVLSEEYGLVVGLVVIFIFAFVTLRGIRAAAEIEDPFTRASATGLFALFGLQAAINLAVTVRLVPPTGMTLPFVSYGGSSMLGTALTLGFALALIRRRGVRIRRPYGGDRY